MRLLVPAVGVDGRCGGGGGGGGGGGSSPAALPSPLPVLAASCWQRLPAALVWCSGLQALASAASAMDQFELAAEALAAAEASLEASPPGTRDASGRPLEMEILATKLELTAALTKLGRHDQALAKLGEARLYTPRKPDHREHFERTMLIAEAQALRCANQLEVGLAQAPGVGVSAQRPRALTPARSRTHPHAPVPAHWQYPQPHTRSSGLGCFPRTGRKRPRRFSAGWGSRRSAGSWPTPRRRSCCTCR